MARLARLTCRSTIPGDSWAIMPGDTTTHKLEPWLGSLVESRHSVGRVLAREGFPRTLLNSPLMDPVGKSEHRDEDADILVKYGLNCLGDILHVEDCAIGERPRFSLLEFVSPTGSDIVALHTIHRIGKEALLRATDLQAFISLKEYDALQVRSQHNERRRFLSHSTTRGTPVSSWYSPMPVAVRLGQCWFATSTHRGVPSFDSHLIYEIMGFFTNSDGSHSYWCRHWKWHKDNRYLVSEEEAGGVFLTHQTIPSSVLFHQGTGLQAILSRDSTRHSDNYTQRSVSRRLLDHGLRRSEVPLVPPKPQLEEIAELSSFIAQVAALVGEEGYFLCTDGSYDSKGKPSERRFRKRGDTRASASLVAIPRRGIPATPLPSLYIPDTYNAAEAAFAMEYLAVVIAKFVAYKVPGCTGIWCDCEGVCKTHDRLPCISPILVMDKIWPGMRAVSSPQVHHIHSHLDKHCKKEKKKKPFHELSIEAQGNCIADVVAAKGTRCYHARMSLITISMEMFLRCGSGSDAGWMRITYEDGGILRLRHSFHIQEKLARISLVEDYWISRTINTETGYDWNLGHTRLAAAAGLVGREALPGKSSTIKLIYGKYWWGNRHNPNRPLCAHCAALAPPETAQATAPATVEGSPSTMSPQLPLLCLQADTEAGQVTQSDIGSDEREVVAPSLGGPVGSSAQSLLPPNSAPTEGPFPTSVSQPSPLLIGMEHWGSICSDPRVVKIREDSAAEALSLLKDKLPLPRYRDHLQRAKVILSCILTQPYRFEGRLDRSSTAVICNELDKLTGRKGVGATLRAITGCMRIFLDAGKDIYSLKSSALTRARERQKAAHKLAVSERKRITAAESNSKEAKKQQSRLAGEEARLAAARGQTCMDDFIGATPDSNPLPPPPRRTDPPAAPKRVRPKSPWPAVRGAQPSLLRDLGCSPCGAPPTPGSPGGPESQGATYFRVTQGYSDPSISAVLAPFTTTELTDYLFEMMRRHISHQMLTMGRAESKVEASLYAPFGEDSYRRIPCLSKQGVLWKDILHHLRLPFEQWLKLTGDTLTHIRGIQNELPIEFPVVRVPLGGLGDVSWRSSARPYTKRLVARREEDPPVQNGAFHVPVGPPVGSRGLGSGTTPPGPETSLLLSTSAGTQIPVIPGTSGGPVSSPDTGLPAPPPLLVARAGRGLQSPTSAFKRPAAKRVRRVAQGRAAISTYFPAAASVPPRSLVTLPTLPPSLSQVDPPDEKTDEDRQLEHT